MVSLNDGERRGAFFLVDNETISAGSINSTPIIVDEIPLMTKPTFHRLNTEWIAVLDIVILIAFVVALFVCGEQQTPSWPRSDANARPFQFFAFVHALVWFWIFVSDRVMQRLHQKSRQRGYLGFYRQTRNLRRIPMFTFSCGNALVLIIVAIAGSPSEETVPWLSSGFRWVYCIGIVSILETVVAVPALLSYIVKTAKFNGAKPVADVEEELVQNSMPSYAELGFRNEGRLEEVLEKQADMIRYLQQHNADLGRRIVQLTTQGGQ
ncbi:transmembrane protein 192-like [Oscarella lobularis]|uniref:transmembrane protein 192-like n=1 Tax=Oscarella lobularis TaxID=121494 RepID=UPI003313B054